MSEVLLTLMCSYFSISKMTEYKKCPVQLYVYVDSVFHTKYQYTRKWQCILEGHVFSHIGRLSLWGFDEMSEAMRVHKTGTSPAKRQNRKGKKVANYICAHVTCLEFCVTS